MIELHVQAGMAAAAGLTTIKLIATRFPGEHRLTIVVPARPRARRLTLGPEWRYDASEACMAALAEFGDVAEVEDEPGSSGDSG